MALWPLGPAPALRASGRLVKFSVRPVWPRRFSNPSRSSPRPARAHEIRLQFARSQRGARCTQRTLRQAPLEVGRQTVSTFQNERQDLRAQFNIVEIDNLTSSDVLQNEPLDLQLKRIKWLTKLKIHSIIM
ncbi:hypothetical protein NDU88_001360 [Pleurodeles waltl]|uniref:Uncharacterized protein n=1 Tax=Pleurodeles waltl TaxID=8319 RepID=A0AAV7U941_PLEWA|nr:hypothetical protein NDU88_001360 [Pleurodeles waltl]